MNVLLNAYKYSYIFYAMLFSPLRLFEVLISAITTLVTWQLVSPLLVVLVTTRTNQEAAGTLPGTI